MYFVNYVSNAIHDEIVPDAIAIKSGVSRHIFEVLPDLVSKTACFDCLLIDISCLYEIDNLTPFDFISVLNTVSLGTMNKPIKIVVGVSDTTDIARIKEMKRASIAGFYPVGPEFSTDEKTKAISECLAGEFHIPLKIKFKLTAVSKKKSSLTLTSRQQQILTLIKTRAVSNKVIAKMLNISESTVKLHVSHIFKKLGVKTRAQLIAFSK